MPVTINGSTGITNVDGSAASPAEKGTTSSTAGVFFPAADTVGITTASTERVRVGPAGQVGIGGANYGTSGQVLTSGGASAAPSWATPATQPGINVQTFTGSGTWTKPAGYSASSRVFIQAWGGGGSGWHLASGSGGGGGGGGGGYNERWLTLSAMGATETITIGAGGAGTTANNAGNSGGNTTVGSLITAYGGSANSLGGGGGGQLSAGSSNLPGTPIVTSFDVPSSSTTYQGAGGGYIGNGATGAVAFVHGAGGGSANPSGAGGNGGASVWGGGGGGGGGSSAGGSGGASSYGGAGGVGTTTGTATAGSQPGGGGGGCSGGAGVGTSGSGGAGQVIITVFPA